MRKFIVIAFVMFALPLISAQLIYQQNSLIDIKVPCFNNNTYCSNSAVCNITIAYPNGTIFIDNQLMTNDGAYHNYTLNNDTTSVLGEYSSSVVCDDGGINGYNTFTFKITGNGKEEPSGIVIVLFSVAFIGILFYLVLILLLGIGHLSMMDFDVLDLAYNLGGYFALFGLYLLEGQYLGNPQMDGFLLLFIKIGSITNVLIPFVLFIWSMVMNKLQIKKRGES